MCKKPEGVVNSPFHEVPVAQFKEDFITYNIPEWSTESYDHEALLKDYQKIALHSNGVLSGIHKNAAYASESREPIAQLIAAGNHAKLVYWSSLFQWVSQTPYPLQDIIGSAVISTAIPNENARLNKNEGTTPKPEVDRRYEGEYRASEALLEYFRMDKSHLNQEISVRLNADFINKGTYIPYGKYSMVIGTNLISIHESDVEDFEKLLRKSYKIRHYTPKRVHSPMPIKSVDILDEAMCVQAQRGQEYDQGSEERNMGRIVAAFNAVHGTTLTEAQGHHFMSVVKAVRLFSVETFHKDSAVDFVSYGALMGEAKSQDK